MVHSKKKKKRKKEIYLKKKKTKASATSSPDIFTRQPFSDSKDTLPTPFAKVNSSWFLWPRYQFQLLKAQVTIKDPKWKALKILQMKALHAQGQVILTHPHKWPSLAPLRSILPFLIWQHSKHSQDKAYKGARVPTHLLWQPPPSLRTLQECLLPS